MKQNIKKLILSFLITSLFSIGLFYVINLYDQSGTTLLWLETNLQYIVFLFVSIVATLTLYGDTSKKSQFILGLIILINFLYIIFSFVISNIGLSNMQSYFLIGFLILSLISNYIKSIFGHLITILCIVGIVFTISFAIIPTYESGPDIQGFEKQFSPKLIIFSKANINRSKATILLDKEEFDISNGLSAHDLKINNSGSQLQFKANKKYLNSFAYILFPNQTIIQIYPQSALNIYKNLKIEIITGTIKYYSIAGSGETKNIFSGENISFGLINKQDTKTIIDYYQDELKNYIVDQIGGDITRNETIVNISNFLLTTLSKVLPSQFSDNLDNFKRYQQYIDINLKQKTIEFDNDTIKKDILNEISESLNTTQIIK